jgi:hypothetical protein
MEHFWLSLVAEAKKWKNEKFGPEKEHIAIVYIYQEMSSRLLLVKRIWCPTLKESFLQCEI